MNVMKKIVGILLMSLVVAAVMTSFSKADTGKGIKFSKLTLEKAQKEAAKTGKLIFIDAYTDWCGPCKQMAATSFMDAEVGEIFNNNFINVKIEMEKDADGPSIAKRYRVNAYPTLLILNAEGNLVKSVVGKKSKNELLALAESVL